MKRLISYLTILSALLLCCGCAGDHTGPADAFSQVGRAPLFEKGYIIPPNSLECVPVDTGVPQTGCNHHGSTVAELPDGTLAAVWYHGEHERSRDTRIVWSRLAPGATEWTWPEVLYDDPGRAEGNPALWVGDDETLYVFFVTIFGELWDESKVMMVTSGDNGATWSAPTILRNEYCWMTRYPPVRLRNNDLMLPLYNECLAYPVWIRSGNDFVSWTQEPHLNPRYYLEHAGQIQPAAVVLRDGTLAAITRDGLPSNRVKRMTSSDNGASWTPSRRLDLPNSGTAVDQVLLRNGHVVVAFNNAPDQRFPLSAALSLDGGETFTAIANLDDACEQGGCSYSYPSITQSRKDGTLWVTYSVNRETIGWVHFNEAWLEQGEEEPNLAGSR